MKVQLQRTPIWRSLWFAALICGLLIVLNLVPAISDIIQAVDYRAAVWFNGAAGVSPVFDRFVLLLADEDGRERLVLLMFFWLLAALWIVRTRSEKARLLSTILFIAAVLGCYFIIDMILDDVIERKSPSYFLDPFRSIGKILDFKVDLKDRRSFPSATAMILLTTGFVLLRLGRLRRGSFILALGLTAPLLLCVAGLNWMSDIYLGALPLSFLISAVAVETPFIRLQDLFFDAASAAIDQTIRFGRSLGPMWRHRRLYWSSQNVFHMEVAVKRFIAREIPAILEKNKDFRHQEPTVEVPLGGLRSVVRIVKMGHHKAVVRAYPLSRRYEAERHYRASTLLSRNGIRVPQIYRNIDSPKKFGALFIVEEFIEGRSLNPHELQPAHIAAAAVELARLHQVTSDVWGPVVAPRTEEHGTVLLRRLERQVTMAERGPILLGQDENLRRVREWLGRWRPEINAIRSYSLIHGKLHRENCLFEDNGGFCLLDITTLEWGIPALDLITVHHSQCGDDPELIHQFNKIYYSALKPEAAAQGQHLEPFYNAVFCLGQVAKYTKRLGRSKKRQVGDAINKGAHWWHKLLRIMEENP